MYDYNATVLKIVDGDTVDLMVELGFGIKKIDRFRLSYINAPEMKTPAGPQAKAYVINMIPPGTIVTIKTEKDHQENYGRYLAEIFINDVSVNKSLIDSGNAVPYERKKA